MRFCCVPGMWHAQLVYHNKDKRCRYDKAIAAIAEVHGGRVASAAQCVRMGQRIIVLVFPFEERRDKACRMIAAFDGIEFPEDEGDLDCTECAHFPVCGNPVS